MPICQSQHWNKTRYLFVDNGCYFYGVTINGSTVYGAFRSVSELVEALFNETRYNSRSRPGADTGELIGQVTGELIA